MDWIRCITSFNAVVEQHSFSQAARKLKISVATISKQVAWLETRLASRLLYRSTRKVTPTPSGELFYQQGLQLLHQLRSAKRLVAAQQNQPTGLLRLNAPILFSHQLISPFLPKFLKTYPQLQLKLNLQNCMSSDLNEDVDIAIRIGELAGKEPFHAKKIGVYSRGVFAAPGYIEANGEPKTIKDLDTHNCLVHTRKKRWYFIKKVSYTPKGNFEVNNGNAYLEAAIAGLGLVEAGNFWVKSAVVNNELVEVLKDFKIPERPIYICYHHQTDIPVPVKCMVDYLLETWGYLSL